MLQLTTPAARGLFQAILADPADDFPRLLLADVLEEAGQGERAEFIRVQIELAKPWSRGSGECWQCNCARRGAQHTNGQCRCSERWKTLRRREREIVEKCGEAWVVELLANAKISGADGSS